MRRVKSGEEFSFNAKEWNSMAEAVEYVQKQEQEARDYTKQRHIPAGAMLILNSTGADVRAFSALVLSDVKVDHGENSVSNWLHDRKYIVGKASDNENAEKSILVTLEDIDAGDLGYAIAYGVIAVEAAVLREEDEYLRPIAGTTKFESCDRGACKIIWKGKKKEDTNIRECLVFLNISDAGESSYRGMFCIERLEKAENTSIIVHNSDMPENENAGIAFMNNQPFEVVKAEFTPPMGESYVYLKFTPPVRETDELDYMAATAELSLETELKESDDTSQWYLVGSLSINEEDSLRISQDHRCGAIRMTWFGPCNLV
ncbi:MAG: hypothetical protein ACOYI9_13555 [Candidatus Hydrogenedentales bacterium]|jgi:hypothetical protein